MNLLATPARHLSNMLMRVTDYLAAPGPDRRFIELHTRLCAPLDRGTWRSDPLHKETT
jgi:hypothetical protein